MEINKHIQDHATEFFDDAEAMHLEGSLWWYIGRLTILRNYLDRARREVPLSRILEIGCGSGGTLGLLSEYGEVTAVERSELLAKRAQSRNIAKEVLVGDVSDVELSSDFDMVCFFDVLEHIEDDDGFLKRLNKFVKPCHLLLLSVPACQFLYGQHDAILHHYRRYSKRQIENLLQNNNYTVLKGSYFLFFLFPFIALFRLKEKVMLMFGSKQDKVNLGVAPKWINLLLTLILKFEAMLSQRIIFPIGIWLIVLARKN